MPTFTKDEIRLLLLCLLAGEHFWRAADIAFMAPVEFDDLKTKLRIAAAELQ